MTELERGVLSACSFQPGSSISDLVPLDAEFRGLGIAVIQLQIRRVRFSMPE